MKRYILLALCLLIVFNPAAYAAMSVRMDVGAILLEGKGDVIVPLGVYEDIVSLGEGLFAAKNGGMYALLDAQGELLTEACYSDFRLEGDMLLSRRDGFWGLMDLNGNEVGAFEYTRLVSCGNGKFWGVKGNVNDVESDELFILSPDGSEKATGLYLRAMSDAGADGLIAVLLPESGLWGYCDVQGRLAIPANYNHAGMFQSGRATVVTEEGYGVIDTDGAFVVSPEYDFLEISKGGFILASRRMQGAWILNMDGAELLSFEGEGILAALVGDGFMVVDGNGMQVYDAAGNVLAQLDADASVSEGLKGQLIFADGAWGEACVYLSGTQERYQNLYPLGWAGGEAVYACMQASAARYVNDLLGEIQLSVDMESARYGVVDSMGRQMLPCEYESIVYLADDRLLVHADGLWQVIDSQGTVYWSHGIRQTEEPSF